MHYFAILTKYDRSNSDYERFEVQDVWTCNLFLLSVYNLDRYSFKSFDNFLTTLFVFSIGDKYMYSLHISNLLIQTWS